MNSEKIPKYILEPAIPVEAIFTYNLFHGAKLLGGKSGLKNLSRLIVILETPNGMEWLQGGEIVLTTGYALSGCEEAKENLMLQAKSAQSAAICVKEGRYFGEISQKLIDQADALEIPLISIPQDSVYSQIISNFYTYLYELHSKKLINQNNTYFQLLSMFDENTSIEDILKELERVTSYKFHLENHYQTDNLLIDYNKVSTKPQIQEGVDGLTYRFVVKTEEVLSYLYTSTKKSLNAFQINVINYGLTLIKSILLTEQKSKWNLSELHNMLGIMLCHTADTPNPIFLSNLQELMQWSDLNFYVIRVQFGAKRQQDEINHAINIRIRKFIEANDIKHFLFVENEDTMLIFMNIEREKLKQTLKMLFANTPTLGTQLTIGVSTEANCLNELKKQLSEAKIACKYASKYKFYADLGNEKYLASLANNEMCRDLYNSSIRVLLSYDRSHDTHLLKTLKYFIEYDRNRSKTAKKLFIHTETLRYRLKRIEELTGLSPYDSDGIFLFMLALGYEKSI